MRTNEQTDERDPVCSNILIENIQQSQLFQEIYNNTIESREGRFRVIDSSFEEDFLYSIIDDYSALDYKQSFKKYECDIDSMHLPATNYEELMDNSGVSNPEFEETLDTIKLN